MEQVESRLSALKDALSAGKVEAIKAAMESMQQEVIKVRGRSWSLPHGLVCKGVESRGQHCRRGSI